MRVLAVQAREPVRGDRVFEKDWPWPNLSDEALWRLKPGNQSSLPWPQSPGQHWRAHPRAEIDQRNDVVQIMAPNSTLWRNEQAERRKPILIDEMLERDRWRIDGVIDVMDALRVRRIDAERMHPGRVLGTRDDLALRERGRQASLIGDDCQICR